MVYRTVADDSSLGDVDVWGQRSRESDKVAEKCLRHRAEWRCQRESQHDPPSRTSFSRLESSADSLSTCCVVHEDTVMV